MNIHSLSFLLLILLTVLATTALCSAQEGPTTTTLIETTTNPTSTKNSTETTVATTLATATATSDIPASTTTLATTTPNATRHRMSYEDWQLLIRSWDFLRGVQRVAFDMCYDEFFNECQPAMQDSVQSIFLQWNKENYRCAPSWCACYDGYIRVLGNTTYCLFPAITGGIVQVCHELEICKPIRLRCADDFIYLQKQLPTRCDSFLNCTLKKEVIQASVGQCDSDWAQCNTELTCQVQRDPLNKLPPPPTPAPFAWTSDLPKALRDIWIVTAAIFGLVLAVAIGAVFLMRRRQRQWQQWYEEASEMAMERAEDVVWFEPEKEENTNDNSKKGDSTNDTSSSNAKKDQDDPSASAPVAHRPQNLSCIRCGAENAPIQLLPCRCRWCGCAEKKTSGSNDGNTESSSSYHPPVAPASPTEDHSRGLLSSADETQNQSEAQQQQEKESTVEIASLSCRGVPKFTRNVPKTVMEQFEERERERQRRETAQQEDNLENNDGGSSTTRRRQQQSSASAKPPRPKCDRCNRVVNFAINFDCLYYPAASQDVSEDGGKDHQEEQEKEIDAAAAVINMSPRETSEEQEQEQEEENNNQKEKSSDEKDTSSSSSRVSSPLTAAAVSSISSNKKKKKKVPTCCICLSEPCSVAIIPCGHVAQCVQCAKKLCVPVARADTERRTFVISSKCPLCREDIVAMASLSKSQNQKAFDKSASAMGE